MSSQLSYHVYGHELLTVFCVITHIHHRFMTLIHSINTEDSFGQSIPIYIRVNSASTSSTVPVYS